MMRSGGTESKRMKNKSQSREARLSGSSSSTPAPGGSTVSVVIDSGTTAYLRTPLNHLLVPANANLEDILDRGGNSNAIPSANVLNTMLQNVKTHVFSPTRMRGEVCDRGMRELARRRKERVEQELERERERAEQEIMKKVKTKRSQARKEKDDDNRPLAVGAHGVARQDGGVRTELSSSLSPPSSHEPPSATGPGPSIKESADSPLSEASRQPPPAPAIPQHQTFGPDPSKFDDPTIYHIRDVTPSTIEEEKREILGVTEYPQDDLHNLTCGTPPDRDFSTAKPSNQTNFTVFSNYVEPYIRPLTEEDIAFLKERGDRVTPFIMPRKGPRHYREIWAEEDGAMVLDSFNGNDEQLPPNEARGSMDQMNDETAETDAISTGPVLARLLSTLRPEGRPPSSENTVNGDITATTTTTMNGFFNGEMDIDNDPTEHNQQQQQQLQTHYQKPPQTIIEPLPPATRMPEASQLNWKPPAAPPSTLTSTDYAALEERLISELRHIGFLSEEDTPDYNGAYDDEVAARLRYLQAELRRVSIVNGTRKARLLELTEERMAMQEYATIADDLDGQLNAAYLKRSRNLGKGKKNVRRPGGGAGGGPASTSASAAASALASAASGAGGLGPGAALGPGMSRPSVGEPIRKLMERRRQWNSIVGPVVGGGTASLPADTVFSEEVMARLIAREQDNWNEAEE